MHLARVMTHGLIIAATLLPMLGSGALAEREDDSSSGARTATPIKHVVIIFQENVSFDHYFGTYPVAANPSGEPRFFAAANTPTVNGLDQALLT